MDNCDQRFHNLVEMLWLRLLAEFALSELHGIEQETHLVDHESLSMTRRGALGSIVAGLTLAGCWPLKKSEVLRYRMTVEVDTPAGLRRGSSVIESTINDGVKFGDASGITYGLQGEAIAVDLPGGRTMFALLRSESDRDPAGYHRRLFSHSLQQGSIATPPMPRVYQDNEWAEERPTARSIKPTVVLPSALYPMLVTFGDLADPKSAERVEPTALYKSFGPGVKLRRVSISVTDDTLTTEIAERIRWLGSQRGALLKIPMSQYPPIGTPLPFATSINETDFLRKAQ